MAQRSTKRNKNFLGGLFKKKVTFHGKIVRSGSTDSPGKKGLSAVQQDVVDALVGMKMSKDQATRKVLAAKDGSFDDVFRAVMKKNPGFDINKAAREFGAHFKGAGRGFGTTKSTAAKRLKKWKAELRSLQSKGHGQTNEAQKLRRDIEFYQKAIDHSNRKNPAKFDRCVKKVAKSAKKKGKKVNAYAVCTAAGTRNKKRKTHKSKRNPKVVWSLKQGSATAEVVRSGLPGLRKYKVRIKRGSGVIEERSASSFEGAQSIARLRVHERAHNPVADLIPGAGTIAKQADKTGGAWGKVARRFKKALTGRKKNPVDKAVKMYEEFHGLPASEIIDIESKEHRHSVKVGIGQLVCLDVLTVDGKMEVPLTGEGFSFHPMAHLPRKLRERKDYWAFDERTPMTKVVLVTSSEDGRQLFLDGGNQEIPLPAFGLNGKDERDHMLVGTIIEITYRTKKSFESKGQQPVDFHHEFGKEGSGDIRPVLLYFPRSKQLKIAGGRYKIAPPVKELGYVSPGITG